MIALTTTHNRWTVRLARLLLVAQALAGAAVPLAHASERLSAPVHIEARHSAGCLTLHDELRCALCHYAGSRVQPQRPRTFAPTPAHTERLGLRRTLAPRSRSTRLASPPRAPPPSRS